MQGPDNLFFHEEAQMSFPSFKKYDMNEGGGSSMSMLIRSDAIVTGAEDNLKDIMERLEHGNGILFDNDPGEDLKAFSEKLTKAKNSVGKGGRFPLPFMA